MRILQIATWTAIALLFLACDETEGSSPSDTGAADTDTSTDTDTGVEDTTEVVVPDDLDPLHITGAPWKGAEEPVVVIVKYSDFECPYCGDANVTLIELLETNPDVQLVYKHLPMDAFHEYARIAAEASMAAFAQDPAFFWALHDLMFANQDALTRADLEGYAAQIEGLDMDQFRTDLDAGTYAAIVQENADEAAHWRVTATPSFLINGRLLQGSQPIEDFQALIDAEREATLPLIASGLTREEAVAVRLDANLVPAE